MADSGRINQFKYKGRNSENARGKRREFAVTLRKDKRREKHDKKRDLGELTEKALEYLESDDGEQIRSLRAAIENDNDFDTQLKSLIKLRRLLAAPKELPIQATLESGVVPKIVQLLQHPDSEVQYEAAWVLTNISSGQPHQTRAVVEFEAAGPLLSLLYSDVTKVQDQACWCLGNIAGDGAELRDMLLELNALEIFLDLLVQAQDLELLRNVSWAISNFFRWKNPPAPIEKMNRALEVLKEMVSQDQEVMSNLCWTICYIAESGDELLDEINYNFSDRFLGILSLPEHDAQLPCIRTMGSITAGTDDQTQLVMEKGLLDVLPNLLASKKVHVRKDTCWTISNLCAGTYEQIDGVVESNILLSLIVLCASSDSFKVRLDAAWALCNIISQGHERHGVYLLNINGVDAMMEVFSADLNDSKALVVFLEAFERALILGAAIAQSQGMPENPVALLMLQKDIESQLTHLMLHDNDEVAQKAADVNSYFQTEDDEGDLGPEVAADGTSFQFGGHMQQPDSGFNF